MSLPAPYRIRRLPLLLGLLLCALAAPAAAFQTTPAASRTATLDVAFTPGDDAAGQIVRRIDAARRQVLVQAFSFTHGGIAKALIRAHRRGIDVRLIADREQTEKIRRNRIAELARAGIPVWLDGEHLGAHNKVMVIDAGLPSAGIITGSFNFTNAAQYKNAENVVFIGDNASLTQDYLHNWQRHQAHSKRLATQ